MEGFGIINYFTFILAGLVLNITPGADTLYILARSIAQGRQAGFLSALGISTGGLIHTGAAALGLSAVLTHSAFAFNVVKYCGAAYLIYLGLKTLWQATAKAGTNEYLISPRSGSLYFSGVLTNVLNPKVALFFLAFLPQFVAVDSGAPIVSFLLLGCTFVFTGTIWGVILVIFATTVSGKLTGSAKYGSWLKMVCGTLFIFLGTRLALSRM